MALTKRELASDEMRAAFVRVIASLRRGEVVSYGEVAAKAGYPNRHRAVGQMLSQSADALPWWRVVYSSGSLPPCNPTLQEELLLSEGVTLQRLRVVKAVHGTWGV